MVVFVQEEIANAQSDYIFCFKIESLGIEETFRIGGIEITFFNDDFFEQEYNLINQNQKVMQEEFEKLYKEFKNYPIARITIKGCVSEKAGKIAKRKVLLAISALKCLLLEESLQLQYQIPDLDFNCTKSAFSTFLKKGTRDSTFNFNTVRNQGAIPIEIKNLKLKELNQAGLNQLSKFLSNEKNSELYFKNRRRN